MNSQLTGIWWSYIIPSISLFKKKKKIWQHTSQHRYICDWQNRYVSKVLIEIAVRAVFYFCEGKMHFKWEGPLIINDFFIVSSSFWKFLEAVSATEYKVTQSKGQWNDVLWSEMNHTRDKSTSKQGQYILQGSNTNSEICIWWTSFIK